MNKNNLITTPQYNPKEVNYILEVEEFVNSILRRTSEVPIYDLTWNNLKNYKMEAIQFYMKFSFCEESHSDYNRYISHLILDLKKLVKQNPELKLNRFVEEKEEEHSFQNIPPLIDSYKIKVKYLTIKHSIISYIQQTIGECNAVEELKELFVSGRSNLSFDEYLNKKTKTLLKLDLSKYVKELNKLTKEKLSKD